MDETALKEEIRAFLQAHHVVSLATVAEGGAHAASLMFAAANFSLYWTSDPDACHSAAIERNPRVAATIAPDYADFHLIRGLQIIGRARRLSAGETAHAVELLRERFPFLRELNRMPAGLRAAVDRAAYYRLNPDTIAFIDNTRGFGNKRTLHIARGA
jgi:uncharacterized protein YhbP (UPF0306 family)